MTGVVLKGLLARKTRAVLTAFAVVLGVSMISGTFVLTDTIQSAFHTVFASTAKDTSVTVTGREVVKGSLSGKATVPATLEAKVRALPDVAVASGRIGDWTSNTSNVQLLSRSGTKLGAHGATFGFGVDPAHPQFNPLALTTGVWAARPGEVVIDAGTAAGQHLRVGDSIRAAAGGPVGRYTIVGLAKLRGLSSTGGATIAAFDVPTAQALLHKQGRFDAIAVTAKPGVTEARLAAEIKPLLPRSAEARTSAEQLTADTKSTGKTIAVIRYILLAFGAIALFVGAFVIFNTISITVAQRAREFATLRTLGASRRQVLKSVLLESAVVGLVASLIGLVLGVGLAKGLAALFVALGIGMPQAATVLATRTVLVSLATGTLVTLAAGIAPAIRATRVPPIAAVREGAVVPPTRFSRRRPLVAAVVSIAGLLLIGDGMFGGSANATTILAPLAAGTQLLFIGIAMVSSSLVRPLAAVVGLPARRLGGAAGRLAGENAVRNTARTATTAGALMIGLALVTFVATLGAGLKSSDKDALAHQVTAGYVVSPKDADTFGVAAGRRIATAPGVATASSVRSDQARVLGATATVVGVDPATIGRVYHFDWRTGSDATLTDLHDGAIVEAPYATKHHLQVGSPLTLTAPDGRSRTVRVSGTYKASSVDPVISGIVIAADVFDRTFPRPANALALVDVHGAPGALVTARLTRALTAFPDAQVQPRTAWIKDRVAALDVLLDLFYVLLALSVIVSLFGMMNTLILSVFERTRELGMLRAVGMTRMQVRRMIRHESIITALIGAALGLPLGVFLAALVTRALSSQGVGFHIALLPLGAFTAVAVLAGVLAAILPARRAARMDVLTALQYE